MNEWGEGEVGEKRRLEDMKKSILGVKDRGGTSTELVLFLLLPHRFLEFKLLLKQI